MSDCFTRLRIQMRRTTPNKGENKMKGLSASIYQSKEIGNCSNKGISSKCKSVILVGDGIPEIFEADDHSPAVRLVKRSGIGRNGSTYTHAEPVKGKDPKAIGWMDGGCFISSSDSRFPSDYPIPLHDRQESQQLYDTLSK